MNWQLIITVILVLAATLWALYRISRLLWKTSKDELVCDPSQCSSCPYAGSCADMDEKYLDKTSEQDTTEP